MSEDKNIYYLLSLGCAKNTVDSESIAQILNRAGYHGAGQPADATVLIVNTCGFIDIARKESIQALQELAEKKLPGQKLIAAGCLSQLYGSALAKEVRGLDGIIGTRRWMDILELLNRLRQEPTLAYHLPGDATTVGKDEQNVMRVSAQGTSAYLKIADGCRRPCAFCTIPQIKGAQVSRPSGAILSEAARLNNTGIQELILISQDTTDYGHDLGIKEGLATLLGQILRDAPDIPWIRIMYAYPGYVTERLMEVMASDARIVPYLDMPLQHSHPDVLRRMKRPANTEWVYKTITKLRAIMPDIAIRTTFIVGYPGETEEEFEDLLSFMHNIRFDRVGAFTYSYEAETYSAQLPNQLPEEIKKSRQVQLMETQQSISLQRNQEMVGKTIPVLVEGYGDGLSIGRSYRDAPEIDGMVIVEEKLPTGKIMPVRITGAMTYDLTGVSAMRPDDSVQDVV